jgi:hypothetical protein
LHLQFTFNGKNQRASTRLNPKSEIKKSKCLSEASKIMKMDVSALS